MAAAATPPQPPAPLPDTAAPVQHTEGQGRRRRRRERRHEICGQASEENEGFTPPAPRCLSMQPRIQGLPAARLLMALALVLAVLPAACVRGFVPGSATCPGSASRTDNGGTVRFLVLFQGSSGSSAFISEVAQHSMIFVPGFEPWEGKEVDEAIRYAREMFQEAEKRRCHAVGFKVRPKLFYESGDRIRSFLQQERVMLILQTRQSVLDRAISAYAIAVVGAATQFDAVRQQRENGEPVGDAAAAAAHAADTEERNTSRFAVRDWRMMDKLVSTSYRTVYRLLACASSYGSRASFFHEEYVVRHGATMGRMYSLLRVPVENHMPLFQPVSDHSACKRVKNYGDMCHRYWCDYRIGPRDLVIPSAGCTCAPIPACHFPDFMLTGRAIGARGRPREQQRDPRLARQEAERQRIWAQANSESATGGAGGGGASSDRSSSTGTGERSSPLARNGATVFRDGWARSEGRSGGGSAGAGGGAGGGGGQAGDGGNAASFRSIVDRNAERFAARAKVMQRFRQRTRSHIMHDESAGDGGGSGRGSGKSEPSSKDLDDFAMPGF